MFENRDEFSIARMAKVLNASESGYYKWLARCNAPLTEKEQEDIDLAKEILNIFKGSRGSYGVRKVTKKLNEKREKTLTISAYND